MQRMIAQLVLEDGTVFTGRSVGAPGIAAGEAWSTRLANTPLAGARVRFL